MIAFFNINNRWAGIEFTRNIISVFTLHKGVAVCINSAFAADCAIIRLKAIDKNKARLAGYRVADKCRFWVIYQLIGANIAIYIRSGFKHRTLLNVQINIAFKAHRITVKHKAALQHNRASAAFCAIINCVLNCKGIICFAVSGGAVLQHIIFFHIRFPRFCAKKRQTFSHTIISHLLGFDK